MTRQRIGVATLGLLLSAAMIVLLARQVDVASSLRVLAGDDLWIPCVLALASLSGRGAGR